MKLYIIFLIDKSWCIFFKVKIILKTYSNEEKATTKRAFLTNCDRHLVDDSTYPGCTIADLVFTGCMIAELVFNGYVTARFAVLFTKSVITC